jgi:hypothetical protein
MLAPISHKNAVEKQSFSRRSIWAAYFSYESQSVSELLQRITFVKTILHGCLADVIMKYPEKTRVENITPFSTCPGAVSAHVSLNLLVNQCRSKISSWISAFNFSDFVSFFARSRTVCTLLVYVRSIASFHSYLNDQCDTYSSLLWTGYHTFNIALCEYFRIEKKPAVQCLLL